MLDFGPGSFFLTPAQLLESPSARHGILASTEKALRIYACEIIQEAGVLLRLPQAVAATAQVLLHRFYCKQSFCDFDARAVAASCFWLSMKLEEEEGASNRGRKPSQLNDVVSMFEHIRARREGTSPLLPHAPAFKIRKEEILKLEMRILVELGFVCHVEHPHKIMLGYLNSLQASKELIQECWNLVNDSLRTTLCVSVSSHVIACGIIYAAARRLYVPLPESPPWWLLFDVTFDQMLKVCAILADLYRQPKALFVDVRTPSSKPLEVASSLPEASPVVSSSKSPESEVVDSVSMPTARHALKDCGLSSSKLGDIAPAQVSTKSKKRARDLPQESEMKRKRSYSNHDQSYDSWDRRRDYKRADGRHRDACRDYERSHRRQDDYPRYSSRTHILISQRVYYGWSAICELCGSLLACKVDWTSKYCKKEDSPCNLKREQGFKHDKGETLMLSLHKATFLPFILDKSICTKHLKKKFKLLQHCFKMTEHFLLL